MPNHLTGINVQALMPSILKFCNLDPEIINIIYQNWENYELPPIGEGGGHANQRGGQANQGGGSANQGSGHANQGGGIMPLTPFNSEHYSVERVYPLKQIIPIHYPILDQIPPVNPILREYFGVDMPYWFDWGNTKKKKLFVVGMAPQRSNSNWNEYHTGTYDGYHWVPNNHFNTTNSIIMHSAWGAHTEFLGHEGNSCLFGSLLPHFSMYFTDFFKIFYKSNGTPIHQLNHWMNPTFSNILQSELLVTKPDYILMFSSNNQFLNALHGVANTVGFNINNIIQLPNLGAWVRHMSNYIQRANLHPDDSQQQNGNGANCRRMRQLATHIKNTIGGGIIHRVTF